jgi:signal transduction histidine kinase
VNRETLRVGLANPKAANARETGARDEPFAAYIAHELRNPLTSQRALLEVALADPNADIASWREVGYEVLDACRQQERVLTACITLSRTDVGLGRCEIVDLEALVARLLRSTNLQGHRARVTLQPAVTSGDPVLIERLLDNLLANAIRHNHAGGWIAITTGTNARQAAVTIENTGTPVSARELSRLFEPFQQGRAPGARSGLGLGLAVVKAIADAHGAHLSAHVRPGGGLRIEVGFAAAPLVPD